MSKKVSLFLLFLLTFSLFAPTVFAMREPPLIVFLGDSTSNSLRHTGVLQDLPLRARVWTGAGNTLSMWDVSQKKIHITDEIAKDIESLVKKPKIALRYTVDEKSGARFLDLPTLTSLLHPDVILVTLGINGCSVMSREDFVTEYRALIDTLKAASPDTRLILHSILPVSRDARVDNASIDKANLAIAALAREYGLPYLDTNALLKTESGYPDPHLLDPNDGIHWNKAGCQKILEAIWNALEALAKTPTPLSR